MGCSVEQHGVLISGAQPIPNSSGGQVHQEHVQQAAKDQYQAEAP